MLCYGPAAAVVALDFYEKEKRFERG
jgi:hypothetical protein